MKTLILAVLAIAVLVFAPARAGAVGCTYTGGALNLEIPSVSDSGSVWGPCLARDLAKISTSTVVNSSTSLNGRVGQIAISTITGNPTGDVYVTSGVWATSGKGLNVTYGVTAGTITATGLATASSGTFTGTAGPYAVTVATGIYLTAGEVKFKLGSGGISWPDGTRSTTAASGSSGASASGSVVFDTWVGSKTITGTFNYGSFANTIAIPYMSTITFVCVAGDTYTLVAQIGYSVDFGVNTAWGYSIDGVLYDRQDSTHGNLPLQVIANEARSISMREYFSCAAGTRNINLRAGESSNGETVTFGSVTTLKGLAWWGIYRGIVR